MKAFIVFINFSFFVHIVASLVLTRQPVDRDRALDSDLRVVRRTDMEDAGILAVPGVPAPTQGSSNIGTRSKVDAIVLPTVSTTASFGTSTTTSVTTSTMQPASVSSQLSATSSSTSQPIRPNNKVPVIVGSILATVILLAIIALLMVFLKKRKREMAMRCIFNREMMVKGSRTHPPPAMSQRTSSSASTASRSRDLEQGLHPLILAGPSKRKPSQDLEPHITPFPFTAPITQPERCKRPAVTRLQLDLAHRLPPPGAPTGPRSPLPRPPRAMSPGLRSTFVPRSPMLHSPMPRPPTPHSPIPRSPSPRTHRQRAIADQIEILRIQILQLERKGGKDGVMDEMCKKLAWLREQQEGPWALGLTEVTPLGYDRYMT